MFVNIMLKNVRELSDLINNKFRGSKNVRPYSQPNLENSHIIIFFDQKKIKNLESEKRRKTGRFPGLRVGNLKISKPNN